MPSTNRAGIWNTCIRNGGRKTSMRTTLRGKKTK